MYFRDVFEVGIDTGDENIEAVLNAPANHPFPFYLNIKGKKCILFASENDEREMWVDCFTYIFKSTQIEQKVINENMSSSEL